jgi:hypothetical protein
MGAVAAVFAYTFLYTATVDVLLVRDSRYTIERWLDAHAGSDHLVGRVFRLIVLPRLDEFQSVDLGTVDDLRRRKPDYFVLNADYARAVPADTPLGELVAGLQREALGYRLALRYRAPAPWPWLPAGHPDLVRPRTERLSLSFLRDINPTIDVYERNLMAPRA